MVCLCNSFDDNEDDDIGSDDDVSKEIRAYQTSHPETSMYEFPTQQYSVDDLILMLQYRSTITSLLHA